MIDAIQPVAALFVRKNSVYKTLPGVDCYDQVRDATTWRGGCPIVAHPPCRTWSSMSTFCTLSPEDWAREQEYARWSVDMIRLYGGVLEHPYRSSLWPDKKLPAVGERDAYGGFTLAIDQFHWGHLCQKRTKLYIAGIEPDNVPPIPHRDGEPTHRISSLAGRKMSAEARHAKNYKPAISRCRRDVTPPDFAVWLVQLARRCSPPGHKHNKTEGSML